MKYFTGTKVPLKEARHQRNMTQFQLSVLSGVNQSRISQFENGKLDLNDGEEKRIQKVLGNVCFNDEMRMPEVDYSKSPERGIKVQVSKDSDQLPNPKILYIGAEEDTANYKYLSWDEFLKQST